jgi:hypothetical protein
MKEKLKLSLDEWGRVLAEAEKLFRGLEARRALLEREYRGFEEEAALQDRLERSRAEGRRFLSDRVEVHIGTIQLLRHTRPGKLLLVPIPEAIERSLFELIGQEATRSLTEVETWAR